MQVSSVSEPVLGPSSVLSKNSAKPWRSIDPLRPQTETSSRPSPDPAPFSTPLAYDVSTHSVQFVASPGKTGRLQSTLPVAIRETLRVAPGFAGCMVMVSDQEARLVTVVTLWTGKERAQHCTQNAACVKKLLTPFVDNWLRSGTYLANFSMLSPLERKFQECCSSDSLANAKP